MYIAPIDVFPRIVPLNKKITFTIRTRYEHGLSRIKEMTKLVFYPVNDTMLPAFQEVNVLPAVEFTREITGTETGTIRFEGICPEEGEYVIGLCSPGADGKLVSCGKYHVYALDSDLYDLTPYKGNFHMHSIRSDGGESPAYVIAGSRENGADFIALTDHRQYQPSLDAIDLLKQYDTDMAAYPGEEIHLADSRVHIVNFGSSSRVNDMAKENPEKFEAEVKTLASQITETERADVRDQLARAEWAYARIQEGGGLAVFCHPYWRLCDHFYISEETIDIMLRRHKFDAVELYGGFGINSVETNMLMQAKYMEYSQKYGPLNIVGVSDCHGIDGELGNSEFTIVFAEENSFASVSKAIKSARNVAVQNLRNTFPIVSGPFRLVRFAYFLLREYFPLHDQMCAEEGILLKKAFGGFNCKAKEQFKLWKGRVPALYSSMKA